MLRILIADDNDDLRRRIRALIESDEHSVVCGEARNGREALELAEALRPQVVLLDLVMPEVSGLDVIRRLAGEWPEIDVIVLSGHHTRELAREVVRAGARAFIDKSEAYERLRPALAALRREVRLGDGVVGRSRHIGVFFHAPEEADNFLRSYVCDGLEHGEKAVHIIDAADHDAHMRALADCGVDMTRSRGQLEVVSWESAYVRNGRFDQTAMLERIQELLREGAANGYPRSRLVAHAEWALQERPGADCLVEYEARLNYVLPQFDDIVTCCYDVSRFDADMIDAAMRNHPAVLIGNEFHENPYYVHPDVMLQELQDRS